MWLIVIILVFVLIVVCGILGGNHEYNKKQNVRKSYNISDIPKIESKNGEMSFGYNEDAFAHIAIQSLEKKTGKKLTDQEYRQVLDELKKESNDSSDDNYNFEDDPDYSDDQKKHIVHDAACCFLDFIENSSYLKVHPLFKKLLNNQVKLKELSVTYPRYEKISKSALKDIDNAPLSLRKFIKHPDADLSHLLKKQENQLFNRFKEYRESSMSRFKKPEIINKHRLELIDEIDEILSNTDNNSNYYSLFSEYKKYNLSITNG
jgi:hypothetical protein